MKVLALDFGSARTGVAVSDPTGTLARPLCVVERAATDAGLERLVAVIREEQPERVVVGMPLTLRGDHGEQARETAGFAESLQARIDVPCRDVRRAIHERARGRRRREGGGSSAFRLPRVVEPRSPVRRLLVLATCALALTACSGTKEAATVPVAAPPPPPKPLRIIFPEGFTRREMAERVTAVDKIAVQKRHVHPRLSARVVPARDERQGAFRRFRKEAVSVRGLPLPGDVRLLQEDDVEAARPPTSSTRSGRTGRA